MKRILSGFVFVVLAAVGSAAKAGPCNAQDYGVCVSICATDFQSCSTSSQYYCWVSGLGRVFCGYKLVASCWCGVGAPGSFTAEIIHPEPLFSPVEFEEGEEPVCWQEQTCVEPQ